MADVVSMRDAKARKARENHKRLVLATFDGFEHEDRREQREVAAERNRQEREKL